MLAIVLMSLGEPSAASVVLCRDAYAVGFSYEYKSPLWASYRTTYEDSKFICDKDPDFRRDPDVDRKHQATDTDYANNDWDKGHIAPRALMDITCPSEV
ncbi:DNA/RNA non-specific endonuclease [Vibrio splendidus]|nr:DNA/RNA non-specific endonuclease [Vibrio splendidus]